MDRTSAARRKRYGMVTYAEYRDIRREYPTIGARTALRWARQRREARASPIEWEEDRNGNPHFELERDGFKVVGRCRVDEYPDFDHLGKFTNSWEPGAIRHDQGNSRTMDWFVPGIGYEEDYERVRTLGTDWVYYVLTVTVSRYGIELGRDSVGGFESDSERSHYNEMAEDCIHEALSEAKRMLDELCTTYGKGE